MQTTWFYVSLYFSKRGRENQSLMKKSMLRLAVTATIEEYFERSAFHQKSHGRPWRHWRSHAWKNIFKPRFQEVSTVQTIKSFLSHLNPEVEFLFQRPKVQSSKFNPKEDSVWFNRKVLRHNTLENVLKSMSQSAGIEPYFTNHSLRATTVTILSSENVESLATKVMQASKATAKGPPCINSSTCCPC